MNVTPIESIAAGQRVKWTGGGSGSTRVTRRGVVERSTPSTVLIQPDHGTTSVRLNANRRGQVELEILTPHELALEAWVARKPTTSAVRVNTESGGWTLADPGARLVVHLDDRSLRGVTEEVDVLKALGTVRAECEALARWVFERPEPAIEG